MLGEGRREEWRRFWRSYIRLGFAVLAGESAATLAYLLTTSGPHRGALVAVTSVAMTVAAAAIVFVAPIAARPWREGFSLGCTLVAGAVAALCAHLDGGVESPLIYLTLLPVASAALAFRSWPAIVSGVASLLELAIVALTDPTLARSGGEVFVLAALDCGLAALAIVAALGRSRLHEAEHLLFEELVFLAETDPLTGCANHRAFYGRLEAEVARSLRHGGALSLVVADVDCFKSFNDKHGHAAGDAVLAGIGAVLRSGARSSDVVGRIGGDEFALILAPSSLGDAFSVARRLSVSLGEVAAAGGVTMSMGIASLDPDEPTAMRLFRDADAALYDAKSSGRGEIAVRGATPPGVVAAPRRLPRPLTTERGLAAPEARVSEPAGAGLAVVRALVAEVERRDRHTAGHHEKVAALSRAIATRLDFGQVAVEELALAAEVHDVGTLFLAPELCWRPDRLSEEETSLLERHCELAGRILRSAGIGEGVVGIVVQHHERLDGSGYPGRRSGGEILLGARVLAVADAVDSMAVGRPYRPAVGFETALARVYAGRGRLFDAEVVEACTRLYREGRLGIGYKEPLGA